MTVATLGAKAQEAMEEIVRRIENGFTGQMIIEFKDGVPQLARVTDTIRFGGALDRRQSK